MDTIFEFFITTVLIALVTLSPAVLANNNKHPKSKIIVSISGALFAFLTTLMLLTFVLEGPQSTDGYAVLTGPSWLLVFYIYSGWNLVSGVINSITNNLLGILLLFNLYLFYWSIFGKRISNKSSSQPSK